MPNKYKKTKNILKRLQIFSFVLLLFAILITVVNQDFKLITLIVVLTVAITVFDILCIRLEKLSKKPTNQFNNCLNIEIEKESHNKIHSENNEINIALLNIGVKNKELFEDTLGEKVARYLKAINDQDEKEIKDVCSGEIAERTIKSIRENDKLGYDLKIENIEIINSTLIDVIPIKKNPIIDIKVIMTIKESIVKENEIEQNIQSDAKVYQVRFNKKDKSQKDYKCDNCGAELSAITEICPYCRTNTEFIEERNWFITSIKEVI